MNELAISNKSKLYIFLEALGFALITVALGWIVGMVGGAAMGYTGLVRPAFTPPDIIFSIVWPILYAMIGVSLYITIVTKTRNKALRIASFIIWGVQLALNFLWVPVFFNARQFFWAFIILAVVDAMVTTLIAINFRINKWSAILLIPYLLWLGFATYLNIMIVAYNV
jgi:tryptophan-rich sensory protein